MHSSATAYEELVQRMVPVATPEDQRDGVAALSKVLANFRTTPEAYKLTSPSGEVAQIPTSVFLLLERIIEVLARGDAITVVPVGKELTTQQAAHILNVSRQYVVRLLDEGKIPFGRTGTHRRIRMEDLLKYKTQRDRERMSSLDELSQMTQDFGGYDEISKATNK